MSVVNKVYLACPFSHSDPQVREDRFNAANLTAAFLMKDRWIVFSPLSHSVPIAKTGHTPMQDWEFWKRQDFAFIIWCDKLVVLELDGWKESVGVQEEIEFAKNLGKEIFYTTVDEIRRGILRYGPKS